MNKAWVLVLDVDDTVYAERDFVCSALRAAGEHAEQQRGLSGLGEVAVQLFLSGRRGDLFQAAALDLHLAPINAEVVNDLVRVYREYRPKQLPWFPDAEVFVRAHVAAGGRLAVITDGYLPTQRNKVEALGLDRLARPVILSEELGRDAWKPSPLPYAAVEGAFPPDTRFFYIADNPLKDFITARARGWKTIRVRRPGTEHFAKEAPSAEYNADVVVSDFNGVQEIVKTVLGS